MIGIPIYKLKQKYFVDWQVNLRPLTANQNNSKRKAPEQLTNPHAKKPKDCCEFKKPTKTVSQLPKDDSPL